MFGGIGTMIDKMATRMQMEANTYRNTFGNLNGFPLLDPDTVRVLALFTNPDSKEFADAYPGVDQDAVQAIKNAGMEGAKTILALNDEAKQEGGAQASPAPVTAPKAAPVKANAGAARTVKMRSPDGKKTKDVPLDKVDHYKSLGAVVVQ